MQNEGMTFRIEMFGNLVDDLKYWHGCLENEQSSEPLEYIEQRFEEVLEACREYRLILIEELNDYVEYCKGNDIPVDISYYRIKKDLIETEF